MGRYVVLLCQGKGFCRTAPVGLAERHLLPRWPIKAFHACVGLLQCVLQILGKNFHDALLADFAIRLSLQGDELPFRALQLRHRHASSRQINLHLDTSAIALQRY